MTVMKIDTFEIPVFFSYGPATVEDILWYTYNSGTERFLVLLLTFLLISESINSSIFLALCGD